LVFLVAAATTSISRAKYRAIPRLKTEFAYLYAGILERYSFLQYSQAGPDQARKPYFDTSNFWSESATSLFNIRRAFSIETLVLLTFDFIGSNQPRAILLRLTSSCDPHRLRGRPWDGKAMKSQPRLSKN
jgi:hypothetical protein